MGLAVHNIMVYMAPNPGGRRVLGPRDGHNSRRDETKG